MSAFVSSKIPKVIVLDFDGVIVESNQIKHSAFRQVFERYGAHLDTIMRYHLQNPMIDRYSKFEHISKNILNLPNAEQVKKHWAEEYIRLTRQAVVDCPFVSGAEDFLQKFKNQNLYLASATPLAELLLITEKRDLKHFFKKIYGAPIKKAQVLKEIQEFEKTTPEEMLFIGDSPSDQSAAEEANIPFIGRDHDLPLSSDIKFADLFQITNYILGGTAS